MLFKMDVKPNFTVENEAAISAPPKVDFNKARRRRPPRRRLRRRIRAGAAPKSAAAPTRRPSC